jgi:DNA-directed RNA polymerase subunit beta
MTTKDYTEFAFTLPDLIEIQRASFRWFLEAGLIEELDSFSRLQTTRASWNSTSWQRLQTQAPKIRRGRSQAQGQHYSVQMYVPTRLINKETGEIKEQKSSSAICP